MSETTTQPEPGESTASGTGQRTARRGVRLWRAVRVVTFTFCALMTAWLIRFEAFPGWFAAEFAGYSSLFRGGTLLADRWAKILYEGEPIGFSHTLIDTQHVDPLNTYRVQNSTLMQMKLLGQVQSIKIDVEAFLDALYQLQRFSFRMTASAYSTQITGRRTDGHRFAVTIETGGSLSRTEVEIPPDVVLYSPMTDMAMRRLRPGQQMVIRTLDPVTLSRIDVLCRALGPELIEFRGELVEAHALTLTYQGLTVRSWLDDEGEVLRQETPLGWVMEAATAEEIMGMQFNPEGMSDLMLATAVPVEGELRNPRTRRKLTIRLHGLRLPLESLQYSRQKAEQEEDDVVRVTVWRKGFPQTSALLTDPVPDELAKYLESTPYVQADHPELIAEARKIVGDATTRLEAARALSHWVDRNVVSAPTASLPSALDVLRERVGDCNEHTYLFVGLARALGIPARIHVGLLYTDGDLAPAPGFYYHAWPAVHLGDTWYEMDPTLSQEIADATHITLLTGELQQQMQLLSVMGQIRAEVVEPDRAAEQGRIAND